MPFDLHRDLIGQHHIANSRASVTPCLTEDLDKKIGTAVDDFGRVVEVRRRVDHAEKLDDEVDAVERVAHGGKKSEPDQPGAAVAFVNADISAELADQTGAIGVTRTLPREVENIPAKRYGR